MKPYQPDSLPIRALDYKQLLPLVGQANAALARYDGLVQGIPNPAVMLSPLTTQEAVLSSRIEGTQATVDEVLEQEAGLIKEGAKFQDIQEISNYRLALFQSRAYLATCPIRLSFVRQLHRTLMDSVRGKDKTPGEFRKDQNWIGKHGCPIEQATFVPPNPIQLPDHLQTWETYLDSEDIDFLLQAVIAQAAQNSTRIAAIQALYAEMKQAIHDATHSQYTMHLLDAIFSKPIFRTSDLSAQLLKDFGIHEKTTPDLLRKIKKAGILRELEAGSGQRSATLCFPRLVNLAEGKEVI